MNKARLSKRNSGQAEDEPKPGRRRKLLKLFVFNVLVIGLLLYAFELVLFFIDPARQLGPDGFVEGNIYTWGHLVETNRFGFREREFAVPKGEGVFRIMVLGDSFTWGAGLAPEERYTQLLEDLLVEKFGEGGFEVLNFGMMGGPTVKERDILRKLKNVIDPDLIVVGFSLNDPQPRSQFWSAERESFDDRWGLAILGTNEAFRSIGLGRTGDRFAKAVYRGAEMAGRIPPWIDALGRTYDKSSSEWVAFEGALEDIRAMSDSEGLAKPIFAVLNQGVYTDRATDYGNPDERLKVYLRWYEQAESAAKAAGFTTFNVEDAIKKLPAGTVLAVNVLDAHPNRDLNVIYAKKLFEAISGYVEKGYLPGIE